MAIYQYTLIIIPKANFDKNFVAFNKQPVTKYRKQTFYFWEDIKSDLEKITKQIDEIVPRASWSSTNNLGWKSEVDLYDNDCSIYIEENLVREFSIRIDLRNVENISRILNTIIKICHENELMLMNLKYEFFEATSGNIFEDIAKSNSYSFLENPIRFLDSLSNEK